MIPIKSQIENPNADVELCGGSELSVASDCPYKSRNLSPASFFIFSPFKLSISRWHWSYSGVSLLPSLRCDQDFVVHCNFCRVCERLSIVCPDLTCASYQISQDVIILSIFSWCHYFCHHLKCSGLVPQPKP